MSTIKTVITVHFIVRFITFIVVYTTERLLVVLRGIFRRDITRFVDPVLMSVRMFLFFLVARDRVRLVFTVLRSLLPAGETRQRHVALIRTLRLLNVIAVLPLLLLLFSKLLQIPLLLIPLVLVRLRRTLLRGRTARRAARRPMPPLPPPLLLRLVSVLDPQLEREYRFARLLLFRASRLVSLFRNYYRLVGIGLHQVDYHRISPLAPLVVVCVAHQDDVAVVVGDVDLVDESDGRGTSLRVDHVSVVTDHVKGRPHEIVKFVDEVVGFVAQIFVEERPEHVAADVVAQ